MASVTNVDLVLLYPWQIEGRSNQAAIVRFSESGTAKRANKHHTLTKAITTDKRTWISAS
jgi:hypothetical protein